MDDVTFRSGRGRFAITLDRVERVYLMVLRAVVLLVATVLLVWAAGWAILSLSRVVRSADSVVVAPSRVLSDELIVRQGSATPRGDTVASSRSADVAQRRYYDGFVTRYYALYKQRFERSQRREDKRLDRGEFDDLTIATDDRMAAVSEGRLDFATDRADLEAFLPIITQAAISPETRQKLARYRSAQRRQVTERVQRTRTVSRRGWDALSTSCAYWYETPVGCAVTRRVEVPYTERVTRLRYPDGLTAPLQILKSYQDRYFALLEERRAASAAVAAEERQNILLGQALGWSGMASATTVAGGFLALMFFFLLIAIERHQRRLAAELRSIQAA